MHHSDFLLLLAQLLYAHDLYIELGIQDGYTHGKVAPLFTRAIGVDVDPRGGSCREFFHGRTDAFFTDERMTHLEDRADLIFIDADHEHAQVLQDCKHSLRLLKPIIGLLALHDTYPEGNYWLAPDRCYNAWEVVQDLKDMAGIEFVNLPLNGIHGLTLIRKASDRLHWMDNAR